MKYLLFIVLGVVAAGCAQNTPSGADGGKAPEFDSCTVAVKFENALTTEQAAKAGFTGDLNNYMGDDTTKLDIKHKFVEGHLMETYFYYPNGKVEQEYHFKCQSLHGDIRFYYEDGSLRQIIPYRYGRRQGQGLLYDPNGVLRQRVTFVQDTIQGEGIIYDEKGVQTSK